MPNPLSMRRMHAHVRALILGGLAAGGVLASHFVGYEAAASSGHHHVGHLLEKTGHDFFGYFVALAIGLLVGGVALFISSRVHDPDRSVSSTRLFFYALVRLLPVGIAAFVGLEALERGLFADHQTQSLFEQAPVIFGIVAQAVIAVLAALFLVLISAVVDAIVAVAAPRRTKESRQSFSPARVSFYASRVPLGGCGERAPPALSI